MAYDEALVERVRKILKSNPDICEKPIFGGVGFLISGNMACGVRDSDLVVRVGADAHKAALAEQGVGEFDVTGRAMKGWVIVTAHAHLGDKLERWVTKGCEYAATLPPK